MVASIVYNCRINVAIWIDTSMLLWEADGGKKMLFFTCACCGEVTGIPGFGAFTASNVKVVSCNLLGLCTHACLILLFTEPRCELATALCWEILVLILQFPSLPQDCVCNRHLWEFQLLGVTLGNSASDLESCLNVDFSTSLGWDSAPKP